MKNHKIIWRNGLTALALLTGVILLPVNVSYAADASGSLSSVTEEARILPIPDGSGKYLMKSSGFYCLGEDGTVEKKQAIHYFDHFVMDGTVFNGYYYHDESGKFKAASPHMVYMNKVNATVRADEETDTIEIFEGYFMAGNLGRLSAAPQIRYIENLSLNGKKFNGYYYFDKNGRMITDPGVHYVDMDSNGQHFEGNYYFRGADGVLVQERGETEEGFLVDETGRVEDLTEPGIERLEPRLQEMIADYEGEWSIYVKDLNKGEDFTINNKPLYSASLIKAFMMAKTYEDMELVHEDEAARMKSAADSDAVKKKVDDILWNMITISDNESFNEMVRLQTDKHDFLEGARAANEYLEEQGYTDTLVQHTLAPSSSPSQGLGSNNTTSVKDCGLLLERIYKGECVSQEASQEMLNLLLNQKVTWKIPESLPEDIQTANKTGETNDDQHDIAIVYGENTTYILCVMSEKCPENTAINHIRSISKVVYAYLNTVVYDDNNS